MSDVKEDKEFSEKLQKMADEGLADLQQGWDEEEKLRDKLRATKDRLAKEMQDRENIQSEIVRLEMEIMSVRAEIERLKKSEPVGPFGFWVKIVKDTTSMTAELLYDVLLKKPKK